MWPENPIRFCPHCGQSLDHPKSLVNLFWTATTDVYFCWCYHCHWRGEITPVERVESAEVVEEGSMAMPGLAPSSPYLH
ncbi:MAG: hypothetical protein K6U87_00510 [Firmicutes bacterium]|nr:hypothetical protein [Bacillota bacterium]